jgi:hypothetical protein
MDKKDSKRPLAPGDRITVCGYDSRGVINENAWHVVESINGDWITCKFHDGLEKPVNVHRRQCRRLKRRERRRWTGQWRALLIERSKVIVAFVPDEGAPQPDASEVVLVEARPRKERK